MENGELFLITTIFGFLATHVVCRQLGYDTQCEDSILT